jgi:hypothetical protein
VRLKPTMRQTRVAGEKLFVDFAGRTGELVDGPTVESLSALGLTAMADTFLELQNAPDAGELSHEDWLGLLVDREATAARNKRLARRVRDARLPQSAVVEDVDFRAPPRPRPCLLP